MKKPRLSYEESCIRLQESYLEVGQIPPIPDHLPQYDDSEPLGVCFFRTFVGEGDDLCNLTLPRTFFGRSEINDVSFENTDFTESNLCWNDFTKVNFTGAALANSDLRCSMFVAVNFSGADMSGSDLRRSSFQNCSFADANMTGAIATHDQASELNLSDEQSKQLAWTSDEGEEPGGG